MLIYIEICVWMTFVDSGTVPWDPQFLIFQQNAETHVGRSKRTLKQKQIQCIYQSELRFHRLNVSLCLVAEKAEEKK